MGMYAGYTAITKSQIKNLLESEETSEIIQLLVNDEKNSYTDISFYWDALHFLLTGEPAGAPKEGHYLSEFIIGETIIGSEFYAACTTADTVKNIVEKINTIAIDNYLKDFSMAKLEKENIYPKIWDDDSLKEDTIESLSRYFEDLRTFYNEAAKNNNGILITIY